MFLAGRKGLGRPLRLLGSIAFSVVAQTSPAPPAKSANADSFEMQVRPILARNCFACHTSSALGGLRLDSREGLLKGGKSGPAIVPGKASDSLLIGAVERTHPRLK